MTVEWVVYVHGDGLDRRSQSMGIEKSPCPDLGPLVPGLIWRRLSQFWEGEQDCRACRWFARGRRCKPSEFRVFGGLFGVPHGGL